MSDSSNGLYPSCDLCRDRKLKCSKETPSCKSCIRNRWQCNYSPKLVRTPLTRSNLTAAEERVRELEAVISKLVPGINLKSVLKSAQHVPQESSGTENPSLQTGSGNGIASGVESLPNEANGFDWMEHELTFDRLVDGMAALSVNPTGAGYLGATSSVAPLRALLNGGQGQESGSSFNSLQLPFGSDVPFTNRVPQNLMLSHVHEVSYIDAYFSHYHTTYPFLHEATFRAQYNGTHPKPDGLSWFMLLNTVLALGAWCVGNDQTSMDDYFYQKLLKVTAESSVFESGNLTLVQALLLLSNYTQKRNRPNTGWNYLGLAVRTAVSLGLHKDFSAWQITPLQREMRRRVWWGLFIFDSGASITFGRPVLLPQPGLMDVSEVLNIDEESLTATSAAPSSEIEGPTVYTGLIAQSKFHLKTNSLHDRLISRPGPSIQEILELECEIDKCGKYPPIYFRQDSSSIGHYSAFLFSQYRFSWRVWNMKIMLLRPVLLRWSAKHKAAEGNNITETEEEKRCRQNCLEHARATIASISEFMSICNDSRLSTWYILYFLFQAALIPILLLMTDASDADAQSWLQDILTAHGLIQRTAVDNDLALRCLSMLNQLCSPVFDAPIPEDVLLNPELFEGGFAPQSFDDFGLMEFGDWQGRGYQ